MKHAPVLAAVAAVLALGFAGHGLTQSLRPSGYLSSPVDGVKLLGPPPAIGSAEAIAETAYFYETRALAGSPRWTQATADAELTPQALGTGFGCAAGVAITPEGAPALARLMSRVGTDIRSTVKPPKDRYQRARPALGNDAPICVARDPALLADGSYPSGHAMLGWIYALILAELVPERADAILQRGKDFGDSRVICGVHHMSDVEAGRTLGAALVARLHGEPQFQADLAAARAELASAGPAANCPTPVD